MSLRVLDLIPPPLPAGNQASVHGQARWPVRLPWAAELLRSRYLLVYCGSVALIGDMVEDHARAGR
ncbi:MAG TPA: hypothetical protein VGD83_36445, partial [Streptosporangiaceae bacterium]